MVLRRFNARPWRSGSALAKIGPLRCRVRPGSPAALRLSHRLNRTSCGRRAGFALGLGLFGPVYPLRPLPAQDPGCNRPPRRRPKTGMAGAQGAASFSPFPAGSTEKADLSASVLLQKTDRLPDGPGLRPDMRAARKVRPIPCRAIARLYPVRRRAFERVLAPTRLRNRTVGRRGRSPAEPAGLRRAAAALWALPKAAAASEPGPTQPGGSAAH